MTMTRVLALAVVLIGMTARAQTPTLPHPDARQLRIGTDSLEVYVVRKGQRQRTGTVVDRLDTIVVNGESRLRRVYQMVDGTLDNSTDTLIDRFPDLQPRRVISRSARAGSEDLTWVGAHVSGVATLPNKSPTRVDTTLAVPTFSGATFDLVLRSLTLATGDQVSVPSFSGREGAATLTARVGKLEVLPGNRDAWRVDANFSGLAVTFWIEKNSHRLVQQSMTIAPEVEILFVAVGG